MPAQLIIADDGSREETRAMVEGMRGQLDTELLYVWHEDKGFRLSKIRNRAIAESDADYIVMIDGDVVLHPRFMADHIRQSREGAFVCGVRAYMDEQLSAEYKSGKLKDVPGFFTRGLERRIRSIWSPMLALQFAGRHSGSVRQICGSNMAFWRNDVIAVNGFDEDFEGWGSEDREIALRFYNLGLKRRTLMFGGLQFHLYHRVRAVDDTVAKNRDIFMASKSAGSVRCANGIDKYLK